MNNISTTAKILAFAVGGVLFLIFGWQVIAVEILLLACFGVGTLLMHDN